MTFRESAALVVLESLLRNQEMIPPNLSALNTATVDLLNQKVWKIVDSLEEHRTDTFHAE